jgi:hypothetical protein
MGVVASAVAALDAHRGIVAVARWGLVLLQLLVAASDIQVRELKWRRFVRGAFLVWGWLSAR